MARKHHRVVARQKRDEMKKVLIFGASGFVGSYLAQEFIKHGYSVVGSDKVNSGRLLYVEKFIKTDLLDAAAVLQVFANEEPDMVINLAGISSVGESWNIPQTTISVNVIGTLNIMEAARRSEKKPKLMFIGSSEEYTISDYPMSEDRPLNASNPYGISKVTQEQFAQMYSRNYGLQIYCVRPFNHTGVGQKDSFVLPSFCKQVAEIEKSGVPGVMRVGNLTVERDFSHVKDIVRAYRMIIESDDSNLIYNVGSGQAHSLRELLNYIIGLSSVDIQIEVDTKRFRPTDQPVVCCDYALIKSRLGWKPEYSVFDALKEMYLYYCGS